MNAPRRQTIAEAVTLEGVGLHLGVPCRLTFRPAAPGSGVCFVRTDLPGGPTVRAHVSVAVETERRTQLGEGDGALHTVEHVLAAVAAHEIDDVTIEMDGPEPPIMDGSAGPFFRALERAGIAPHGGRVEVLRLSEPVRVELGDSWYVAYPAEALSLEVSIDFPHALVGHQEGRYEVTAACFARELADARTFGFAHEVEYLRGRGLIKGGSTQNAVVLGPEGVVENELRWADEFVRHKAMDCVGDLALAGKRVLARVVAHRPSHAGTVRLVRELTRKACKETQVIHIEEIMRLLPHRYPFLLVDRVIEYEEGKRVVGIKNVTINEPFFQGHFPGHPIMPGVLIIEAMAQVGGILLMGTVQNAEDKVVYFTSLDNVKWRKPVRPGDQLRFELEVVKIRGPVCQMRGVGKVDGSLVAEADMSAMLRDR
ncbi:MAG: bifunctional UDP-3-O-[3-hydroxymyristoyl] N-acetylglucosamine deacetylase/3-hydroxyacyl-ACP dehydratase [Gemmatimonadaceae bacterium]|nr:bifunctional UDP-3-O-[3-hydroxymyristoyl] N-acetylglucosamine deacetylase/3-hydroxyacyl-ACP dehydratase [Gemmatimonadaceae bacterium]